jgi:hypothetical protein
VVLAGTALVADAATVVVGEAASGTGLVPSSMVESSLEPQPANTRSAARVRMVNEARRGTGVSGMGIVLHTWAVLGTGQGSGDGGSVNVAAISRTAVRRTLRQRFPRGDAGRAHHR